MVERHNCLTLRGLGGAVGGGGEGRWGEGGGQGGAPYVIFQQITHGNTVSES